ncbi:MAG TPA: tetratricopeptide repeat protein [Hyphomonadaceae bacterium]|nr:tetratricopeptide repeat protein [Hyphomonadaceae bacterium]
MRKIALSVVAWAALMLAAQAGAQTPPKPAEPNFKPSDTLAFWDKGCRNLSGNIEPGLQEEECRSIIVRFPSLDQLTADDKATYLVKRANARNALGKYADAIADYTEAFKYAPDEASIYFGRGRDHYLLRHTDLAIADFDQAISRWPEKDSSYAVMLQSRCIARVMAGKELDKADADCAGALGIKATDTTSIQMRGVIAFRQQRWSDAWNLFDTATELGKDPAYLYDRGVAALKAGRKDAGEADIAKAKAADPKVADSQAALGIAP